MILGLCQQIDYLCFLLLELENKKTRFLHPSLRSSTVSFLCPSPCPRQEVVRVRLSTIALQGARTAQLPFGLAIYLAFAISACELQRSVQFFILEAAEEGFEDVKSMLQDWPS